MNVTNLLATQASQTPDASAIATNMGALSFADLDRAVSRSAKSFQDQGLESGDWVGILLAAPVQNLVASLAVARLGAGQVPIYTSDKPAAVRQLCKSLNIDWVISDSTGASPWTRTLAPPPGGLAALKALRPIDFPIDSDGESLFTVMRTSGTSAGKPKLGYLTQAAGVERISVQNDFAPGDRFLQLLGGEYYSARQDYIRCISAGGCAVFDETVTV
ncbi:MAG: AMP-binding protein, partial [Rhodospirillaceae bacterium]|nr:AMP-binding protein [Rhodospirillaceae bacterium]